MVGCPMIQGAVVTGIHGIGVSTPSAAAVAAATVGLVIELHTPNGKIFSNGLLSIIVAAGSVARTLLRGSTMSVEGAAPKAHLIIAPLVTNCPN